MKAQVGSTDIRSGSKYATKEVQGSLSLNLNPGFRSGLQTLVMYDKDMIQPYIHYLLVNIMNTDMSTGFESISYQPPNPPKGSGSHRYTILLYQQLHPYEEIKMDNYRADIDLLPFIKDNYGGEIFRVDFLVENSEARSDFDTLAYDPMQSSTKDYRHLHHKDLLKQDGSLTEQQQKYCSCLVKVEAEGSARNPYAVCAKTVGTTSRECSAHYNYEAMPNDLLRAYMNKESLPIPKPWNRQHALNYIRTFLSGKK